MTILKKVFPAELVKPDLVVDMELDCNPTSILRTDSNDSASTNQPGDDDKENKSVYLSHDFLAQEFTARHQHEVRYVAEKLSWYKFDGVSWKEENTLLAFDLVRIVCREYAKKEKNDEGRDLLKGSTIASVERIARAARETVATIHQWDQNPWLLNTPSGVIDLKTGKESKHQSNLYMTKVTGVAPKDIATPTWDAFLNDAQPDEEVQSYLYRRAGYCATGSINEDALFFDYGSGGNGKGVYHNALKEILGDYSISAPIDILIESKNDRHPTELARLHNARMVALAETNSGRSWNEGLIKKLSGRDPVDARFMRQDFFTFIPQFKLCIQGNHMPTLRNVDDAIKRRLQLLAWNSSKGKTNPDTQLGEKLKAEYPGILYKIIQGCLAWQEAGLQPPASVTAATNEYLHSQDVIGRWLEECDKSNRLHFAKNKDLFDSFKFWCESQRESPGKMTGFTRKLEKEHGYKRAGKDDREGFLGIKPIVPNLEKLERDKNQPAEEIEVAIP